MSSAKEFDKAGLGQVSGTACYMEPGGDWTLLGSRPGPQVVALIQLRNPSLLWFLFMKHFQSLIVLSYEEQICC